MITKNAQKKIIIKFLEYKLVGKFPVRKGKKYRRKFIFFPFFVLLIEF